MIQLLIHLPRLGLLDSILLSMGEQLSLPPGKESFSQIITSMRWNVRENDDRREFRGITETSFRSLIHMAGNIDSLPLYRVDMEESLTGFVWA